jgi:hypothetical protein
MSADLAVSGETISLSISWRLAVDILHVTHIKGNQMLVFNFIFEAKRYGQDGPGIESRWGQDFSAPVQTGHGIPPNLLYNGYRVSFQWVKWPGRGADHPPLSRAEVKERVELYFYTPSWPSCPVIG